MVLLLENIIYLQQYSIALTASCYSYHTLEDGEQPNKGIQLMWCINHPPLARPDLCT